MTISISKKEILQESSQTGKERFANDSTVASVHMV